MKKLFKYIFTGASVLALASCNNFLDINENNPNTPTTSTPELVLPQALTYMANNFVNYSDYGRTIVYIANAGGYGGFGTQFTYDYTNANFNNLFNNVYDNVLDLEFVVNNSDPESGAYFIATSKIAEAYLFMNLVNEYNDVPYTEAAKGSEFLVPKYDKPADIYNALAKSLDDAIAQIKAVPQGGAQQLGSADVLFKGDMTKWIQFANTIKLKLYVFAEGKGIFTGKPTFSAEGFLDDDAAVNPGYQKLDGKQNPWWNMHHSTFSQSAQAAYGRQYIPNTYTLQFYNGNKIDDELRGKVTYRLWPDVKTNFMGNTPTPDNLPTIGGTLGSSPFYIGTPGAGTGAVNTVGTLKGFDMSQPIMLAAESYFLQAEAIVNGIITGSAKEAFNSGIEASFRYLYKDATNEVIGNPAADAATYISDNPNSPLVNFSLANTKAKQIEAIVTQKFIAYNNIGGHIAWQDFRRTGYPAIVLNGSASQTFVATKSNATTVDRLPGRILYPTSEFSLNAENVPANVTVFGSYVFYDRRSK